MTIKPDFFNLVAAEIRSTYFPNVAYYRDNKDCEKATYALELFNNGCLTYKRLLGRLSRHCNAHEVDISLIVDKHIDK